VRLDTGEASFFSVTEWEQRGFPDPYGRPTRASVTSDGIQFIPVVHDGEEVIIEIGGDESRNLGPCGQVVEDVTVPLTLR